MTKKFMLAIVFAAAVSFCAAAPFVEASASVDKNRVELGDVVRYTVTVNKSGGGQAPAVIPPQFDGFRQAGTFSSSSVNIVNANVRMTTSVAFDLVAVKSGEIEIAPSRVQFHNPDTKKIEEISTKSVRLTVGKGARKSAPPPPEDTPTPLPAIQRHSSDIREIRMSLELRLSDILPYLILGAVFVAALIFAAYRIFRKKEAAVVRPEPADHRKEAQKRIKNAEELVKKGMIKEYHYEIYEIIREYLSAVLGISFREMTTAEIIGKIRAEKPALKKSSAQIEVFFRACDAVKFAGHIPGDEEIVRSKKDAEAIIESV